MKKLPSIFEPDETGNIPSPFLYLNPESRDWLGADEDDNDGEYEGDDFEDCEDDQDDEDGDSGWGLGVIGIPTFPIFPLPSFA